MSNKAFHRTAHKVRRPVNADVRWIMKKVIPILIIALAASVFLGGRINLRRKYNRIVNELAPQPYAVVPMSADSTAFLTTALTNWTKINRNGGDLYSAGLNTVGLEPVSYTHLDVYKRQS